MSNRPAEPFLLLRRRESNQPVTNEELSEQIGAVSSHLQVVHGEAVLAKEAALDAHESARAARKAADNASTAANDAADSVAELRRLVLTDHAPRITRVEEKAEAAVDGVESVAESRGMTLPPGFKRGAIKVTKYAGLASLWPIIEALLPLIQKALKQ